jgi:hypothetical protein
MDGFSTHLLHPSETANQPQMIKSSTQIFSILLALFGLFAITPSASAQKEKQSGAKASPASAESQGYTPLQKVAKKQPQDGGQAASDAKGNKAAQQSPDKMKAAKAVAMPMFYYVILGEGDQDEVLQGLVKTFQDIKLEKVGLPQIMVVSGEPEMLDRAKKAYSEYLWVRPDQMASIMQAGQKLPEIGTPAFSERFGVK